VQVASESTLKDAEGVYITTDGPGITLGQLEPHSMERFMTLRSLWLRQVNIFTVSRGTTPRMPSSLRHDTVLMCRLLCRHAPVRPEPLQTDRYMLHGRLLRCDAQCLPHDEHAIVCNGHCTRLHPVQAPAWTSW